MGLSAELVVTTLVGLGLGWLVGGIGARPVFVVVGGLLGGAAGVNTVYRTWKKTH
jgi:F0F1-type ATP synthase assembly protein I